MLSTRRQVLVISQLSLDDWLVKFMQHILLSRLVLRSSRSRIERDMEWINLAKDVDMWRAVVNAVMSLRVP